MKKTSQPDQADWTFSNGSIYHHKNTKATGSPNKVRLPNSIIETSLTPYHDFIIELCQYRNPTCFHHPKPPTRDALERSTSPWPLGGRTDQDQAHDVPDQLRRAVWTSITLRPQKKKDCWWGLIAHLKWNTSCFSRQIHHARYVYADVMMFQASRPSFESLNRSRIPEIMFWSLRIFLSKMLQDKNYHRSTDGLASCSEPSKGW